MWKDINYDWGGFSRKWQSELVAQKGAWMEMRWPRPIWCFLGTLNWSQFPSLLRQPGFITTDSISFVLLVRFDEQSWWDNAPAKYNQLKWWNAQQMWIKRKRCKFLEDQIDSLMWHLIYKTVWFEPKFNRKFRFGTLTLAGPGSSSGEFVARRQTSLHLLRMFRKKPKDVCFLGVLRGLPDLLQYYIREGVSTETPKLYYVIYEQPLILISAAHCPECSSRCRCDLRQIQPSHPIDRLQCSVWSSNGPIWQSMVQDSYE